MGEIGNKQVNKTQRDKPKSDAGSGLDQVIQEDFSEEVIFDVKGQKRLPRQRKQQVPRP